jgi:hypothetical protein
MEYPNHLNRRGPLTIWPVAGDKFDLGIMSLTAFPPQATRPVPKGYALR